MSATAGPEGGPEGGSPDDGPLVDLRAPREVLKTELLHHGAIWDITAETVDLGPGGVVRREIVHHPGAVIALALDDQDRVLMIRQYRHPVRTELWELPAGLLDIPDEDPAVAAARELAEEADLIADRWDVLADMFNTPGGSDEAVRIFLARDLRPVPAADRHVRGEEELGMPVRWVPLEEARDAILAGRIHNGGAIIGVLAAVAARELGWSTLRPADSPWPEHPAHR